MQVRQVTVVAAVGVFGLVVGPLLAQGTAFAAPGAPMGASAVRAGDHPYQIRVLWKPVAGADHYVVEINDGDTDTVDRVPASATTITLDAPDPAARYLVSVGTRDANGSGGTTGWMTVRSLLPGAVGGLSVARTPEDRSVAVASWRAPMWPGYAPQVRYRTRLVRSADDVTVADRTTTDLQASFTGVDRREQYLLSVTAVNDYGTSLVATAKIGADLPGVPRDLTAVREDPEDLAVVTAGWQVPADLAAPPTHYTINYWTPGRLTRTVRVDAPATTGRLRLDPRLSWTVRAQAFNDVGASTTLSNTVTLDAVAAAGNPDTIAPTLVPTLTPRPNRAGWNNTAVAVAFTCADTQSGVDECTDPTPVAGEGAGQAVTGTAVDFAGNRAAKTTTVNIDTTPPTITATMSPDPTAAGWVNRPVTVSFTCADALSGVASCPDPVLVPADVATHTTVTATATDVAGNSATTRIATGIDTAAPTVSATVSGTMTPSGWYRGPVTVHYTCTDALSGIDTCPTDTTIDTDAVDRSITATAADKAGNSATTSVTGLNVDTTPPTVTADRTPANHHGWNRGPVTVAGACTDAASGVATCPSETTLNAEGANQTVTLTGSDRAGNTTTTLTTVNIDTTPPTITATITGTMTPSGWYRGPVTVHYTCTDALSGIDTCPTDTTIDTDTTDRSITATTTDKAGNSATTTVAHLNIDATAPVVTVVGATDAASYGLDTPPTAGCRTSDAASGVARRAAATTTRSGHGRYTATCAGAADAAGNTTAPVTVTYTITPTVASLTALTHQYVTAHHAPSANGLLHDLDNALTRGRYSDYLAKVNREPASAKPNLTAAEAAELAYWATTLAGGAG